MPCGPRVSKQLAEAGAEIVMANHLAPFLLTNLLQDQLLAAPAARVVTVATEIYSRKLDFENLQGERSSNFFKAYQQSSSATSCCLRAGATPG
jgi:hypothetical protein